MTHFHSVKHVGGRPSHRFKVVALLWLVLLIAQDRSWAAFGGGTQTGPSPIDGTRATLNARAVTLGKGPVTTHSLPTPAP